MDFNRRNLILLYKVEVLKSSIHLGVYVTFVYYFVFNLLKHAIIFFSIHNYEAHSSDKKRATFAPCRSVMSRCEFVAEYTSGILTPDSAT